MIILGIVLMCVGVGAYIYGDQLNNNLGAQLENLFNTGTTNPGSVYITIGLVITIVGFILLIVGIVKRMQKNKNTPTINNYSGIQCPHCGHAVTQVAVFCPSCGNKIK